MLEDHIVPFIKRWHFGLGLLNEQGGETIHKEVNRLACRAWGAQTEADKLRILCQERLLENSVELQNESF